MNPSDLARRGGTALYKCIRYLWLTAAWTDKAPIVVTAALAAIVTYWVAPGINERFERQKMQATYVLDSLKSLNQLISDLYVSTSKINYAVAAGEPAPAIEIEKSRENIARIHWKAIETATMLPKAEDKALLDTFLTDVGKVSKEIDQKKMDVAGAMRLQIAMKEMSLSSVRVFSALGNRADLSTPNPNQEETTRLAR